MSLVSKFNNATGDVLRLQDTTTSGYITQTYTTTVASNVKASVQPASEELIALGQGDFYNTFTIYFEVGEDVTTGDQYVVNGTKYIIQGVQKKDYNNRTAHLECSAITE